MGLPRQNLRCRRHTCPRDGEHVHAKSPLSKRGGELQGSACKHRGAGDQILPQPFCGFSDYPSLGENLSPPSSSSPPPFGWFGLKAEDRVTWRPVSADLLVAGQKPAA